MASTIFPAIDLRGGKVVRLLQGDYAKTTCYELDPTDQAKLFEDQGATALHVVDLDGARDGMPCNFETVRSITQSCNLFTEIGGGVRNRDRIAAYLDAGVDRVILGTSAVNDPDFLDRSLDEFGADHIVVGVDLRDGCVAVKGWTEDTGLDGMAFIKGLHKRGIKTVICTDISCDGAMAGTNRLLYEQLLHIKGLHVVASGGVSSLEDVSMLCKMGVPSIIIGKALYEEALDLPKALAIAAGSSQK